MTRRRIIIRVVQVAIAVVLVVGLGLLMEPLVSSRCRMQFEERRKTLAKDVTDGVLDAMYKLDHASLE